jgi:uncharacterized membrane protein
MTRSKQEALSEIAALVAEAGLSQSDLLSLLPKPSSPNAESEDSPSLLQRVMVYIGGLFIFTGVCVYIGIVWEDLPSLARVIVTFGTGLVAFFLGLISLEDPRYSKASTPLFLIAAFLQPVGLFVLLDKYFPSSHDAVKAALVVFGFMTVQQFVAFVSRNRSSLLFFSLFFFYLFLSALVEKADIEPPDSVMLLGLSGLYVSYGLTKTIHHAVAPFFFFFAGISVAAASFDYFEDSALDVLLIGVSGGLIALSVFAKSRTLLTVGIISLLAFLGYFTDEYFKDIVGWPIALIILGFLMIGISVFAVKIGRKIRLSSS